MNKYGPKKGPCLVTDGKLGLEPEPEPQSPNSQARCLWAHRPMVACPK